MYIIFWNSLIYNSCNIAALKFFKLPNNYNFFIFSPLSHYFFYIFFNLFYFLSNSFIHLTFFKNKYVNIFYIKRQIREISDDKNVLVFLSISSIHTAKGRGKFAPRETIREWRLVDWKLSRFPSVSSCTTGAENKIQIAEGI